MMKILCLLLILANVSFFLWEFRAGAFDKVEENSQPLSTPGVDTILLANEVEKESALALPDPADAGLTETPKAEDTVMPSQPNNDIKPSPKPNEKQPELNQDQVP